MWLSEVRIEKKEMRNKTKATGIYGNHIYFDSFAHSFACLLFWSLLYTRIDFRLFTHSVYSDLLLSSLHAHIYLIMKLIWVELLHLFTVAWFLPSTPPPPPPLLLQQPSMQWALFNTNFMHTSHQIACTFKHKSNSILPFTKSTIEQT